MENLLQQVRNEISILSNDTHCLECWTQDKPLQFHMAKFKIALIAILVYIKHHHCHCLSLFNFRQIQIPNARRRKVCVRESMAKTEM